MAEPGRFPASTRRWRVQGAVVAIERDLERSVLDKGRWFLCSRIEGGERMGSIDRFRNEFKGGWRTASEVDALTLRAALAPEDTGLSVACAVASSPEQASRLLDLTPAGTIRIGLCDEESMPLGAVIPGPWPVAVIPPVFPNAAVLSEAAGVQLALFGDSPMMYAS